MHELDRISVRQRKPFSGLAELARIYQGVNQLAESLRQKIEQERIFVSNSATKSASRPSDKLLPALAPRASKPFGDHPLADPDEPTRRFGRRSAAELFDGTGGN